MTQYYWRIYGFDAIIRDQQYKDQQILILMIGSLSSLDNKGDTDIAEVILFHGLCIVGGLETVGGKNPHRLSSKVVNAQ